jgi:hypothetical protein
VRADSFVFGSPHSNRPRTSTTFSSIRSVRSSISRRRACSRFPSGCHSVWSLELAWSWALFVILSVLLAANVDTIRRTGESTRVTRSWGPPGERDRDHPAVADPHRLPWILGGTRPDRRDLTWAIVLAFAAGFLSICATVTSAFDTARFEAAPAL